jgi:thiol-disulfide isomerase/thioredoxin
MERVSARIKALLATAAMATCLGLAACGDGDEGAAPAAPDYKSALAGSPKQLAALHRQEGELLDGGTEAFDARLRELRGYPVVVNKWASWCGPCKAEFPHFQSQAAKRGDEVAFLGIDSNDGEDSAREFLADYPVPYPSYLDPELEIADTIEGALAFPATAFYDRKGELVHVQNGVYASEDELAADIKRYAR